MSGDQVFRLLEGLGECLFVLALAYVIVIFFRSW